jgi:hypothetical protein
MQPIDGLITYLHQRLGSRAALLVLAASAAALLVALLVLTGASMSAADPVQMAPLRWANRDV